MLILKKQKQLNPDLCYLQQYHKLCLKFPLSTSESNNKGRRCNMWQRLTKNRPLVIIYENS